MPLRAAKSSTDFSTKSIDWSSVVSAGVVAAIPIVKSAVTSGASYLATKLSNTSCGLCKTSSTTTTTTDPNKNTTTDETEYTTFPGGFTDMAQGTTGAVKLNPLPVPRKSQIVSQTPQQAALVSLAKEQANLDLVGGFVIAGSRESPSIQEEQDQHQQQPNRKSIRMQATDAVRASELVAAQTVRREIRRRSLFKLGRLPSVNRKSVHRTSFVPEPQPFTNSGPVVMSMSPPVATETLASPVQVSETHPASQHIPQPADIPLHYTAEATTNIASEPYFRSPSPIISANSANSANSAAAVIDQPTDYEYNQAGDSRPSSCTDDDISVSDQDIHDSTADQSAELTSADVSDLLDRFFAAINGYTHSNSAQVSLPEVNAELTATQPEPAVHDDWEDELTNSPDLSCPATAPLSTPELCTKDEAATEPTAATDADAATNAEANAGAPPHVSAAPYVRSSMDTSQDENRNGTKAHSLLNFKPLEAGIEQATIMSRSAIVPFNDAQDIIENIHQRAH